MGNNCPARVSRTLYTEWIWCHHSTCDLQAACVQPNLTTAASVSQLADNVCLHPGSLNCWSGLILKVNSQNVSILNTGSSVKTSNKCCLFCFCIYFGFIVILTLYNINLSVLLCLIISNQFCSSSAWWVVRKSDLFSFFSTTQNKAIAYSSTGRSDISTLPGKLPQCIAKLDVLPTTYVV